jgi:GT2 family glycosyltransferase
MPLAESAAAKDLRIKVIKSHKNGGISGARNIGLENATGDWIGFLDHDDLIHPQALGVFARWIQEHSKASFIFSNEAKISEDSSKLDDFFYKPDFCPSTLLRSNYIAHFTFLRRDLMLASKMKDGRWFRAEFDGVEDHDYFLRVSETPGFSAKPLVHERGIKLVNEHLTARGLDPVDVAGHLERDGNRFLRVRFKDSQAVQSARVLVIIPFKDGWELTKACLEQLEEQNAPKIKCVLIDNNSVNPDTRTNLDRWLKLNHKHEYIVHEFKDAFNFAKMNNEAVGLYGAAATHLLFLNNDVELTDNNTIETMVSNPGSGGIQHGGIKFGLEMRGGPLFRTTHMTSYQEFVKDDHVVTAVTFACAMCRKEVFNELGGLEENWLPNGFGDVDINVRAIKAGYRNLYLGSVGGIHHESKTRKDFCEDLEQVILYERNADQIQPLMLRQLGYDTFLGLQTGAAWFAKPLRYRIADRVNNALKSILGPFHRRLRSSWKQLETNLGPTNPI